MSEQRLLYEPIKRWLESKGFSVVKNAEKIMVPIKDVYPIQYHIQPDVIGIRDINEVCVVEVETNIDKILEVMGKCMLWKTTARYVFIAYPKEQCCLFNVLQKFGIGLLGVLKDEVEEIVKILPSEKNGIYLIHTLQLAPIDPQKEAELYRQIKRWLKSE